MTQWFKNNMSTVWSWVALIAAVAIIFALSRGTQLAQLGLGLLAASIALFVSIAAFEILWQAAVKALDSANDKQAPGSTPKHRQRGQ